MFVLFFVSCEKNTADNVSSLKFENNDLRESKSVLTDKILSVDELELLYNGDPLNEDDLKNNKYLNLIHTKKQLDDEYQTLNGLINQNDSIIKLTYNELAADFDNDGEEEIIIEQKWYTASSNDLLHPLSYTYLWYIDNEYDLCSNPLYIGFVTGDFFSISYEGKLFICILPEIGAGEWQYARCFTIQDNKIVECLCDNGELKYTSVYDNDGNRQDYLGVAIEDKIQLLEFNGNEFYYSDKSK